MSTDEADALEEELKRKWDSRHREDFFHKMERKFRAKRGQTDLL